jgi:hypothetical protein
MDAHIITTPFSALIPTDAGWHASLFFLKKKKKKQSMRSSTRSTLTLAHKPKTKHRSPIFAGPQQKKKKKK